VTHWRVGRHRDHRIACELVRDACFLSGLRKLEVEGRPFRPRKLIYATAYREDAEPPDVVVDVTDQIDTKLEALSSYTSQFTGVSGIGEVFPAGNRPLFDQIRAKMAHYGSLIRVEYGEPFRVDEPVAVEDLSAIDVSTF
jgi:LmbE family N-acetylglucosaminyl deacetylase